MVLRDYMIAVFCIMMEIALAACGSGSTSTASITLTGQTDVPSMSLPLLPFLYNHLPHLRLSGPSFPVCRQHPIQ